ncbi:MAG: 30S ribosomal protein S12 methylthiotransferase RimO [Clostridia bacterium]|nr:30S ribosomal protein S12 methylthiotransferase RimO [Clostridia bacterium]
MNKKIGFVSLGCAKNLTDTETMLGILTEDGYEITADVNEADVIVVNTCAFIDSAKEESIGAILEMAEYKSRRCELLIVTGCLAQRYREDIESELSEVDIILGTTDYAKIAEVIGEYYHNGEKHSYVGDANTPVSYDLPRIRATADYTAYLKIADGCDNYCTYCIIPKLRGRYKSRPEDSIIAEAEHLAAGGVKELILIAQDTAYYGKDRGEYALHKLLKSLSAIDGIEWIRLQYCYPENITDELVEEIATNPKVVKYIDMPLQHVSDNVLKRMGRRSRQSEIESLIAKLRQKISGIVIRTSLIVGFPGETEDDFQRLKTFLTEYPLDRVGAFTYSCEEGTPAAEFDDQIDEEIKLTRHGELMELLKDISYKQNQKKIGTVTEAIAEGYDEDEFCYVGRTAQDTPEVDGTAYIYSKYELNAGDIVEIKILEADEYDVTGEVVNEFTK